MQFDDCLAQCKERFMNKPGVVGVGRGKTDLDEDCVVILLQNLNSAQDIPDSIDGIPILKKEVGAVKAGNTSKTHNF